MPKTKTKSAPPPLKDHICRTIYSANLAIQRIHKASLDEMGITYPQYLVMNLLWERDGRTVGDLAKTLELEASTLTPLLKRLETAGHLRRVRNPQDERQVLISLTEKGRELRDVAGCVGTNLLSRSGMSMDELQQLNRNIAKLHDRLIGTEDDAS